MAKIKLTKSVVDAAQAQTCDVELRDTIVPGFLCKVTPSGRKVFMLQYRTNSGVRRKPALGQFGELTVEQARSLAQDWLAEIRRGGDPGHDKAEARKAPTVGTHGIRHRSATDIANSGIPVKVGMALTAHKTVAMFMRYVHTEDDPVRKAAELVANRRKSVVGTRQEPKEVTA